MNQGMTRLRSPRVENHANTAAGYLTPEPRSREPRAKQPCAINSTKIDRRICSHPAPSFRCATDNLTAASRSNSSIPEHRESAGLGLGIRPSATPVLEDCTIAADESPALFSKSEQLCAAPRIHNSIKRG